MDRHLVALATFLVEAQPRTLALRVVVFDLEADKLADVSEAARDFEVLTAFGV